MGLFSRQPVILPSRGSIGRPTKEIPALTASAVKVRTQNENEFRRLIQPWQQRALSFYDLVGECWFAAQFYARSLSQIRIYAAELTDDGEVVETKDERANEAVARIQDPGGGRSQFLGAYGRLMFVTGEGYTLVTEEDGIERWEFVSSDELRIDGSGNYTRFSAPSLSAEQLVNVPDDAFTPINTEDGSRKLAAVYRFWRPHPRYSALADSPLRATLDVLEELLLLTLAVRARAKSRISGPGLLLIPEEVSPAPPTVEGDEDALNDPFLEELIEAMVSPITDEGTASAVVPLVVRGQAEYLKEIRRVAMQDPMETYPEEGLRSEAIRRFAMGADFPPEILLGLTDANHWCVDQETEILTETGWVTQDKLKIGDGVLTLDHQRGVSEWQPVLDVARFEVENLEMVSMEGRHHSSLTTSNHRWPVLKQQRVGRAPRWTVSSEINTTDSVVTAAQAEQPEAFYTDEFVELVAWCWTDGSCRCREGRISPQVIIYQSETAHPDRVERIRGVLTEWAGQPRDLGPGGRGTMTVAEKRWCEKVRPRGMVEFRLNATAGAEVAAALGDKQATVDFVRSLTTAQLLLFLEVSALGDGQTKDGKIRIRAASAERLLAPEMAAILLGRSTQITSSKHHGFKEHTMFTLNVSERTVCGPKGRHKKAEKYTGVVWCPVTGNQTWLARRNGKVFYTGNTGWQIDEQTAKSHIFPVCQQFVDSMTGAYLRPFLKKEGVSGWDRFVIAYDGASVVNKPDRAKDAKDLHDRLVISDAALRDAGGHTDTDAPSEEELKRRIGLELKDKALAVGDEAALEPTPEAPTAEVQSGEEGAADEEAPDIGAAPVEGAPEQDGTRDMVAAACQMAVLRGREIAGAKIRKGVLDRTSTHYSDISNSGLVAAVGPELTREISQKPESELVDGCTLLLQRMLAEWRVDQELADLLAAGVKNHTVKTIYAFEDVALELPPGVKALVAKV